MSLYSGVATLSCTDSSTASSDTSDPGSPYSPPSIGENDHPPQPTANSTPNKQPILIAPKMPPLTSITSHQPTTTNRCQPQNQPHQWPWNNSNSKNAQATNTTASSATITTTVNNNNSTNINNNKLKRPSNHSDKNDAKKSRSTSTDKGQVQKNKQQASLIASKNKATEDANAKITGYFKAQTKNTASTLKKDISNIVLSTASLSSIPPLTEISSKPKSSESLKKYFNLLASQASQEQQKSIKSDFEVRPVTTLTNSAAIMQATTKKVERKTAKVSPMVSNNIKKPQKLAAISPKKPVTIAPRINKPVTNAQTPIAAKKLPTNAGGGGSTKFMEQMKQLPPPPTVVLTAIRIPSQAQGTQPPPLQPTSMSPPKTAHHQHQQQQHQANKVGPVFSMMPNLVQIPNLVQTHANKAPGLVMNNGIAAARINAAAQLLMNGAVIKLQQMQNGENPFGQTNASSASAQLKQLQAKNHPYATTQQLTPQLFMTTTGSGIYYNAPIQMYAGMQNIPALQPIQPQTLPSINTILPSHHQKQQQQQQPQFTTTSQQTQVSVPVTAALQVPTTLNIPSIPSQPKPLTKSVASTTASIGSQTTFTKPTKYLTATTAAVPPPPVPIAKPPALLSEPPKLVPVGLKVNTTTALPSSPSSSLSSSVPPVVQQQQPPAIVPMVQQPSSTATAPVATAATTTVTTVIDLCSPTLPTQTQLSPKLKVPPSPTSPKSLVLERIKLKKTPPGAAVVAIEPSNELKVDLSCISLETSSSSSTLSSSPASTPLKQQLQQQQQQEKEQLMLPPPLIPSLPERAKSPILSQPKTIRFPVQARNALRIGIKGARRSDGRNDGACYWDGCNKKFENNSQLLDHLQTHHVNPQTGPFSCLWSGCKVHGRKSCSRTWLERHVLPHGGNRTYKCIVDGCGLRFPSQVSSFVHKIFRGNSLFERKKKKTRLVNVRIAR